MRQSMDEGWEGETVHGYWMKAGRVRVDEGKIKLTSPPHSSVRKGDIVLVATNTIMTFCFCAALSSDGV